MTPPLRLTRRRAIQAAAVAAVAKLPEAEAAEPEDVTTPDPSDIRPTLPFTPSQASALCRPTCEGHGQ